MTELGPFHLSAASLAGNPAVPKLEANPYSWDHVGNLLILEHPPGTGFSYCHDGTGKLVTCTATFSIILDHFSRISQLFATPHAWCTLLSAHAY